MTSQSINALAAALAKAQGTMKNATLNKVNPHFKNRYADLAGIRDAVTPALAANGLAVTQVLDVQEGAPFVVTRLLHTSGEWIESRCPIPAGADMQKLGSAITYARRYSLSAICNISADEDDDANAASQPAKEGKPQAVPKGFSDWLTDLESVADEGEEALREAWKSSPADLRSFLTATQAAKWEAIKNKAKKSAGVPA